MNMLAEPEVICAAYWRAPFAQGRPARLDVRAGSTVADIVAKMPDLPSYFQECGVVCINGHELTREQWHRIRPKAGTRKHPVTITLHLPLQGGRGGGQGGGRASKTSSIIAIVAMVALAFVTFGIGTFGIPGAGGALAAGAWGAKVLAGAIGIAGSLAIAALTAPPQRNAEASPEQKKERGPASATGNILEPGGALARVVGTRKIFPNLACQPLVDLVGDDEFVEAVYCLAGPHLLEELRINDGSIEDAEDIEYQTREGWLGDEPIDLVGRQGVTSTPQIELSAHDVQEASQGNLENQASPEKSLPTWHEIASRRAPQEIWIHLAWPEGLTDTSAPTTPQQIPIRIRFRKRGDSAWINCPEIHMKSTEPGSIRRAVKFKWGARPAITGVPSSGWVAAFKSVPAGAVQPFAGGWTAGAHFTASGDNGLYLGNAGSTGVANTVLEYNQATFYLDSATHLPGIYEFQIMRGLTFVASSFAAAAYTYSGVVRDFFGYYSSGGVNVIARSRANLQERCYAVRIASVWNEHPISKPGMALIAIKAKNRSIDQMSVRASGYVKDWDGTWWNTWTTTSNPAPHFADILIGEMNPDPLPEESLDGDGIVAWRARCTAEGYKCDAIFQGERIDEVLGIVASCGYARPYMSEVWGVIEDYDRSAESEVLMLTPRNSSGFSTEIAFNRIPHAFRVSFPDIESNYDKTEIIVFRDGITSGDRLERVDYEGIVDETKAQARALFDLRQVEFRNRFYSLRAPAEIITCRRGDMIGVQHDTLDRHSASARIAGVNRNSAGEIEGVHLDSIVSLVNEDDVYSQADIYAVDDVYSLGMQSGVVFQSRYGEPLNARAISNATGESDYLTFSPVFVDDEVLDNRLAVIGPIGAQNIKRLVIYSINYRNDYSADLVLVDEAPELWS